MEPLRQRAARLRLRRNIRLLLVNVHRCPPSVRRFCARPFQPIAIGLRPISVRLQLAPRTPARARQAVSRILPKCWLAFI